MLSLKLHLSERISRYISRMGQWHTGKALANKMLGFVRNHLDPIMMRGQAYDGASNMSGMTNGAAARISSQ